MTELHPGGRFVRDLPAGLARAGVPLDGQYILEFEDLFQDPDLEDWSDRLDAAYGHTLRVVDPGRGTGRRVYSVLTRLADAYGVAIVINPTAPEELRPGELNQVDLESWYYRLGFVRPNENSGLMVREPTPREVDRPYLATYAPTGAFLAWVRAESAEVARGRALTRYPRFLVPADHVTVRLAEPSP